MKDEIDLWENPSDDEINLWKNMVEKSNRKTIVIQEGQQKIIDSVNYFGRPVLGKIVVLPMSSLPKFTCDSSWACISITDTDVENPIPINEKNRIDILRIKFDDIEFERQTLKPITEAQGAEIWTFVDNIWDKVELLMVHCVAGISRSTAVSKAISDIYQPEYSDYYDQLYSPNKLVYEIMRSQK